MMRSVVSQKSGSLASTLGSTITFKNWAAKYQSLLQTEALSPGPGGPNSCRAHTNSWDVCGTQQPESLTVDKLHSSNLYLKITSDQNCPLTTQAL